MEPLLAEYDPERGADRLWIAVGGDRSGLAVLAEELREIDAEIRNFGEKLTVLLPAAEIDRQLKEVAEKVERVNGNGQVAVTETRIVPAGEGWQEGEPIRIGRRFRIASVGANFQPDDKTILLTASSVFGSGLHPSTRLVALAMDELAERGLCAKRVLDVGTGSGLLAMIAARLGGEVLGIDVAPEAIAAARRNAAANGLEAALRIEATPLAEVTGRFDLILANLTASVQLRLAGALRPRLAPDGELIVSGLLGRQQEEMASFWKKKGLETIGRYAEGKWRALRLRRVESD